MKESEIVAQAITEAVCAQFMDFLGTPSEPASFDLKTDIFLRVHKILTDGIDV